MAKSPNLNHRQYFRIYVMYVCHGCKLTTCSISIIIIILAFYFIVTSLPCLYCVSIPPFLWCTVPSIPWLYCVYMFLSFAPIGGIGLLSFFMVQRSMTLVWTYGELCTITPTRSCPYVSYLIHLQGRWVHIWRNDQLFSLVSGWYPVLVECV